MAPAHTLAPGYDAVVARLRARAVAALPFLGAAFPEARFRRALARALAQRFSATGETPSAAAGARFLESLHAEDLALACACAEGQEEAWEVFVQSFRPQLYAAARAVAGGEQSRARELADSLYADLFGLEEREGPAGLARRSLFDYFHGRSRLSTWLRALLAQRMADAARAGRRTESLDAAPEHGEGGLPLRESLAAPPAPDAERRRYAAALQEALAAALGALVPRDRLRLSYYYVQDLTLAQIGRLLGEHEATVSRKLERSRRELRAQVERALREERRLSEAQIALCYEAAGEDGPFDLEAVLAAGDNPAGGKSPP